MPGFKRLDEVVAGVTAKELGELVRRIYKYSSYLENREYITLNKWNDYDGSPYEDTIELKKNMIDKVELWRINFYYSDSIHDADGYDFDYSAVVARNYSDEEGIKPSGPSMEKKFILQSIWTSHKEDKTAAWVAPVYRSLIETCERLEAMGTDLALWASSDLDMRVWCNNCRSLFHTILPNTRLRELVMSGVTMERLKSRLMCKKCGKRVAVMRPN